MVIPAEGSGTSERFDVLDAQGVWQGYDLDKHAIHDGGHWHGDIHVWMTDGTHLMQQQRGLTTAIMPGEWDVPAGHVSAGESPQAAAVRELYEETGKVYRPEQYVHIGSMSVEMAIPGWQQPHRTYGEHFAVYDPELRAEDLVLEAGKALAFRAYPLDRLEQDLQTADGRARHASHPLALWRLGLTGLRRAIAG